MTFTSPQKKIAVFAIMMMTHGILLMCGLLNMAAIVPEHSGLIICSQLSFLPAYVILAHFMFKGTTADAVLNQAEADTITQWRSRKYFR